MFPEWTSSAGRQRGVHRLSVTQACIVSYRLDFYIPQALCVISKRLYSNILASVSFYDLL
jgi:hypothetical protein